LVLKAPEDRGNQVAGFTYTSTLKLVFISRHSHTKPQCTRRHTLTTQLTPRPIGQGKAISGTESRLTEKHRPTEERKEGDGESGGQTEANKEKKREENGAPRATRHPHPED